ncbi:hypothetical protein SAMD00019534_075440 [Acytostelium subglobosum LB1]|uniref:hypothetical protein n=1 Tax=Acytostelium subglobosum LB1 TaxID=1410327 RepID=UPI00064483A0|nr:hypothetical protein SAMD00019534_075440 [Acytostelium subglobosum LB1]GAM24369.1 hypothetical protein SAMD00019534_075440 [Acytostelium subglobosum LB1]|eukprot:XP_012752695.1 hypothetical protein SAMD00019534_075440 [Acytostelium subglobosum LB1]
MQFQALRLFERAYKRVPLIRFPNRHAGETHVNLSTPKTTTTTTTATPTAAPTPSSSTKKGNFVYITAAQAPKRLKLSTTEMDLVSLGGAIEVAKPAKSGKPAKK